MNSNEKVFGVGFSKTATTSLEVALETLGYNVCQGHWQLKHNDYHLALYVDKNYEELRRMSKYWDAFADGPWGGTDLYKQLYDWYPDAHYIQTVRDPAEWYDSLIGMITSVSGDTDLRTALDTYHQNGFYGSALFFRHIFQIEQLDGMRRRILDYFETTNAQVQAFFRAKNAKFIQIDITQRDGWETLCPFLDCPLPALPFPKVNLAAEVRQSDTSEEYDAPVSHPRRHE